MYWIHFLVTNDILTQKWHIYHAFGGTKSSNVLIILIIGWALLFGYVQTSKLMVRRRGDGIWWAVKIMCWKLIQFGTQQFSTMDIIMKVGIHKKGSVLVTQLGQDSDTEVRVQFWNVKTHVLHSLSEAKKKVWTAKLGKPSLSFSGVL